MIILKSYATIPELIHDVTGIDWFVGLPIYSFGFFVALGFMAAAYFLSKELKRREGLGLMTGTWKEVEVGAAPKIQDFIGPGIMGFIIGLKVIGAILNYEQFQSNPQVFLLSSQGSMIGGLIGAALSCFQRYREIKKAQLDTPKMQKVLIMPSSRLSDIVFVAAIVGVLGSNLFNWIDHPEEYAGFWESPGDTLFSGLTIYGGLLCGAVALVAYCWYHKIAILHFLDSICGPYMLAYGIGRLGCHTSGDGDWGMANLLPKPDWIPQWLWASNYENNIIKRCCYSDYVDCDCSWAETPYLVDPVWPTPLYELAMCLVIVAILWGLRKKLSIVPGFLFSIFLIFNGLERFLIEKIRVNQHHDFLGMSLSQAEIISFCLMVAGVLLTAWFGRKYFSQPKA